MTQTGTGTGTSAVNALALTACPLLAAHLAAMHPRLRTGLLTHLTAEPGHLRDTDALLLLRHPHPTHLTEGRELPARAAAPGPGTDPRGDDGAGAEDLHIGDPQMSTTTLYLGTDLDDAGVWARAVALRAARVLFLPDHDAQLAAYLEQHLGPIGGTGGTGTTGSTGTTGTTGTSA